MNTITAVGAASCLIEAGYAPTKKTGIYLLIKDDSIVYIGQSKHMLMRICQHAAYSDWFDRYLLIEFPHAKLDDAEGALIRHLQPARNRNVRGYMHCPYDAGNDAEILEFVLPLISGLYSSVTK
jgi:hypothetical protein